MVEQSTETQESALKTAGADMVRCEQVSGTSREGRKELETLLEFIRKGDLFLLLV